MVLMTYFVDWKVRQTACQQVVILMESHPNEIKSKTVKLFDTFMPRLNDSNIKVNMTALLCLPKMIPIFQVGLSYVHLSLEAKKM